MLGFMISYKNENIIKNNNILLWETGKMVIMEVVGIVF